MRNFFDWYREKADERPWLILGKGPSFAKRDAYDMGAYRLFSLNHVVRELPVQVAHIIDYDVVDACGDALVDNAEVLVMPWFPHVGNTPGAKSLEALAEENPTLKRLNEQGRLLWYNLSTAKEAHGDSPVVKVRYFSADAALNLLATAGAKTVRSLGVDGGQTYSQDFNDLKDKTLLANGRSTFNKQFEAIAAIISATGVDFAPLDIEAPVRVYVATTEAQMLAVKVLEYSIRKHASLTVEIFPMHLSGVEIPLPKDQRNQPRTPFSFQRLIIPEIAGFRGRAIYLDSDMQVFQDIRELWTMPFNGADLLAAREPDASGRKPQFSVMLLDCDRLRWDIREIVARLDSGALTYEKLMYEMAVAEHVSADISPDWNSLERYEEGKTRLLHYTDMSTQPWISIHNPNGYLWTRDLLEAIDAGVITRAYVEEHVQAGYLRPSLLYQVDHRLEDSLLLPAEARALDEGYRPPHMAIHKHTGSPWRSPVHLVRAVVRHLYMRSPLSRLERRLRARLTR